MWLLHTTTVISILAVCDIYREVNTQMQSESFRRNVSSFQRNICIQMCGRRVPLAEYIKYIKDDLSGVLAASFERRGDMQAVAQEARSKAPTMCGCGRVDS